MRNNIAKQIKTLSLVFLMLLSGISKAWGQTTIHTLSEITDQNGSYILASDFSTTETPANGIGSTSDKAFKGTIDGGLVPITGTWNKPLFTYSKDATFKNIIIENVTINEPNNSAGALVSNATGATRIYNCGVNGGSIGAASNKNKNAGGLVGNLEETSRVINCYSYANIISGKNVGGIVGFNSTNGTKTTAGSINTMVMNCMFYGDIMGGTTVSPVYGGTMIDNLNNKKTDGSSGLNNFNYYAYDELKSTAITSGKYNCALAVEEKYLNRIEFYRLLLNSNKKLAAYYASTATTTVNPNDMAKWVLETADRTISNPKPYPILKEQGKYPSIINIDAEHAPLLTLDENDRPTEADRNKGGKIGTLTVNINIGSGYPTGASIKSGKSQITLIRTDKDEARFNFNYDKIQLPYYNEVGTKNYTGYKVVTGWKITAIDAVANDPYTSANYPSTGVKDFPDHNYADRKSSNKDLYSVSGRVFSQGAYFDVPYGVSSITIEPYWGNAAYVADEYLDVVCKMEQGTRTASSKRNDYVAQNVTQLGKQFDSQTINIDGSTQTVYTSVAAALANEHLTDDGNVYDNAVVLVGNLHQIGVPSNGDKAFTMMSVDLDKDNEPDYSLIFCDNNRCLLSPLRFDFLNIPGMAQAQKPRDTGVLLNAAIFRTKGWFEITNTAMMYFSQFEYENLGKNTGTIPEDNGGRTADAPLILQGGFIDQFVSTQSVDVKGKVIYIHVGSNVLINSFGLGTHSDGSKATPHVPVSVTGGDFKEFYLTGTYNQNANVKDDNAECYISGGRFGELAGAAQEQIGADKNAKGGNVRWQIYDADITDFFGGGINDAKPVKGNITTDIFNSHVGTFCGGPKFGNMATGKTVTTTAEGCTFDKYFGAGYGGNSYSRKKYFDNTTYDWNTLQGYYNTDRGLYFNGKDTNSRDGGTGNDQYGKKGPGVATDFDYEFFVWTNGTAGVRYYVKFISFSLAQCNNVVSNLKKCTVKDNFYGGGNLGKVSGTATSILEDCTVTGDVFGAGYSATLPKIMVRSSGNFGTLPVFNGSSGMFEPGVPALPTSTDLTGTEEFEWKQVENYPSEGGAGFDGKQVITTQNISPSNLGSVGSVNLTILGNTTVGGSVYGGGALASMDTSGETKVNLIGGTINHDVYGGGQGRLPGTKDEKGNDLPEVAALVGSAHVNLNGIEKADYVAADHSALLEAYPENATGEDIQYYTLKTKDANNQAIKGCVVKGNIFGCNNLNGTPKGDVTVNVYKTEGYAGHIRTGADAETSAEREATLDDIDDSHHSYEVKAVYGGGNLAAYEPDDANNKHTQVNIYGCGDTSIQQVYGGGNAASTPATQVDIHGTYEIEEVFGGGNGKDDISRDGGKTYIKNPGANVGFKDYWDYEKEEDMEAYNTKEKRQESTFISNYVYGSGEAHVNIHGGRTHRVYGGSNTKGNVKEVAVTMLEDVSGCDFKVDEAYGGGKSAEMDGQSRLEMACIPGLKNAYGGAEAADIQSDVTLNITNGNFDRVFGGNNVSGTIHGKITVNIEETGCHLITIGQLYGGGNQAAYTGPEILDNENTPTGKRQGPTVNARSFTSIGEIYGGGYGKTATVTGDTYVNINVCDGKNFGDTQAAEVTRANEHTGDQTISFSEYKRTDDGGFETDDDGNRIVENQNIHVNLPPYTSGIGGIGTVYGGGNAAKVIGDTYVNIGTESGDLVFATPSTASEANRTHEIKGANITGNVYGGGNAAEVTGSTHVTIGKETTTTPPAPTQETTDEP